MTLESINMMTNWAQMNPIFIIAAVLWTLVWKGLALWRSAELRQKYWFIALLIVNSLGILEIIYLFLVAKNYRVEVIEENK